MSKATRSKELPSFSFSLKKIEIIEKSYSFPTKHDGKIEFDFGMSLKITLNEQKHQSMHFMGVSILTKHDNKKVGSIGVLCIFDIPDLPNLISINENEMVIPEPLKNLLNTVVIGTTRGLMYSQFIGTRLEGAILPVLDPRKFERTLSQE